MRVVTPEPPSTCYVGAQSFQNVQCICSDSFQRYRELMAQRWQRVNLWARSENKPVHLHCQAQRLDRKMFSQKDTFPKICCPACPDRISLFFLLLFSQSYPHLALPACRKPIRPISMERIGTLASKRCVFYPLPSISYSDKRCAWHLPNGRETQVCSLMRS